MVRKPSAPNNRRSVRPLDPITRTISSKSIVKKKKTIPSKPANNSRGAPPNSPGHKEWSTHWVHRRLRSAPRFIEVYYIYAYVCWETDGQFTKSEMVENILDVYREAFTDDFYAPPSRDSIIQLVDRIIDEHTELHGLTHFREGGHTIFDYCLDEEQLEANLLSLEKEHNNDIKRITKEAEMEELEDTDGNNAS